MWIVFKYIDSGGGKEEKAVKTSKQDKVWWITITMTQSHQETQCAVPANITPGPPLSGMHH